MRKSLQNVCSSEKYFFESKKKNIFWRKTYVKLLNSIGLNIHHIFFPIQFWFFFLNFFIVMENLMYMKTWNILAYICGILVLLKILHFSKILIKIFFGTKSWKKTITVRGVAWQYDKFRVIFGDSKPCNSIDSHFLLSLTPLYNIDSSKYAHNNLSFLPSPC